MRSRKLSSSASISARARRAGLKTRIIAFDHNCDHRVYSETVLGDPRQRATPIGSGFHLYLGNIDA